MKYRIFCENPPCLAFLLDEKQINAFHLIKESLCELIQKVSSQLAKQQDSCFRFRGVAYNKLSVILESGVDVTPTNSVIYLADNVEKAMEYGWDFDSQKMVLLLYNAQYIERTFVEVSADTSKEEVEELMNNYPTIETSRDGKKLWLSRLAKEDKRRTTEYEVAYAGWIQANPFEALAGIILIGAFNDAELTALNTEFKHFTTEKL